MRTVVGGGLIPPYNQNLDSNSTEQRPPSQFGLSWYWDIKKDGRRYIGHSLKCGAKWEDRPTERKMIDTLTPRIILTHLYRKLCDIQLWKY
ncbi:unnamed protein product [Rotaria sp. Silwood2]|nr:unnamed protein product [Rotaria sp. Silwood2]CAF4636921.1 unnamed protein product [Rotaria sp. Silwood2]